MASSTLASGADHKDRVQLAQSFASGADMTRGDIIVFKIALGSLERYFQDLRVPFNLDSHIRESLSTSLAEQKERCEATSHLLENIFSRYDRFLNLVSCLHPHPNGRCIQKMLQLLNYTNIRMVEQNSKMTAEMKELAKQNAEQATQSARQTQSMAVLAYETKRDSEVMKAITVVTLLFLPPTFVSVSPIPRLECHDHLPIILLQTVFSMGFLNIDQDQIALSHQGRIYLACTLPLTFVVVGASFMWIWWTGKKEQNPSKYSAGQVLAQAADTLRLGAGHGKEGV
jgi:hypothetical protein